MSAAGATTPSPVAIFASPKSSTFASPRSVTKMFAGLRSRCTMPARCAASSASAICSPRVNTLSIGIGLPPIAYFSVRPCSRSMTRKRLAVVHADVVDGADVRMVERRGRPSLALEALQRLGARRGLLRAGTSAPRAGRARCPRPRRPRPCHRHRAWRRSCSARRWCRCSGRNLLGRMAVEVRREDISRSRAPAG